MFKIDLKNRKPIYEQIVDNFKKLIIRGVLIENSKVQSVREMAKELGVNPNTVQKAYRELEGQSYFYTVLGQGNFIAAPPENVTRSEINALYDKLASTARELIFRGESPEAVQLFVKNMNGKGDEGHE